MKGREAVRAANRRTEEARVEAEQARTELAKERADRKRETDDLLAQVKRLKADHMAEASRLAAEEITRRLAEAEEERRQRGVSVAVTKNLLYQKDKFVRNACRYVSMTTGLHPSVALETVVTWMTDEDFVGVINWVDLLVKCGLPHDGWVASYWKHYQHDNRRIAKSRAKRGDVAAVSLDRAEAERNPAIHPKYDPKWYPPMVYPEIELIDD